MKILSAFCARLVRCHIVLLAGLLVLLMIPLTSSANMIIVTTHNALLLDFGTRFFNLDGRGPNEVRLAEAAGGNGLAFINQARDPFDYTPNFIDLGPLIDGSTTFSTRNIIRPALSNGSNYVGLTGYSSCLGCFGWLQLDFDGQRLTLVQSAFENMGNAIAVGQTTTSAVPEPGTLFLFGSGLAGLAAWRYRKHTVKV